MITINETNVTIMTRDMDGAIAFYEQIGFAIKQRWDNHYAMMTAGDGLTIGLHPMGESAGPAGSGSVSIGLMVAEISEAKALLDGLSIAYKAEDGGSGKYVHFKDLDGTVLYYVQPGWK